MLSFALLTIAFTGLLLADEPKKDANPMDGTWVATSGMQPAKFESTKEDGALLFAYKKKKD